MKAIDFCLSGLIVAVFGQWIIRTAFGAAIANVLVVLFALLLMGAMVGFLLRRRNALVLKLENGTRAYHTTVIGLVLTFYAYAILTGVVANKNLLLQIMQATILLMPVLIFVGSSILLENRDIKRLGASRWIFPRIFGSAVLASLGLGVAQYLQGQRGDGIQGLQAGMGAGHHVFGGVAAAVGVYLIFRMTSVQRGLSVKVRYVLLAVGSLALALVSDTKQLLGLAIGLALVTLLRRLLSRRMALTTRISTSVLLLGILIGAGVLAPAVIGRASHFEAGLTWKFAVLKEWAAATDTLDKATGMGGGQSVSKLGLVLADYAPLLARLGLPMSASNFTQSRILANDQFWLSNSETGSSLWSQFFTWAGIIGDYGILGSLLYVLTIGTVLCNIWFSGSARTLWLYLILSGILFFWPEEFAFGLSISLLTSFALEKHVNYGLGLWPRRVVPAVQHHGVGLRHIRD